MKKNLLVLLSLLIVASLALAACTTREPAPATPIPVLQGRVIVLFEAEDYDKDKGMDQVVTIRIATSSGSFGEKMTLHTDCGDIKLVSHHPSRESIELSCLLDKDLTLESEFDTNKMWLLKTHGVPEGQISLHLN